MRASVSRTRAASAPNRIVVTAATWLLIVLFLALTAGRAGGAPPARKQAAADTSDGGFRVRVVEERSRGSRALERARREAEAAREEARTAAERAARAQAPALPDPPEPPEPPDTNIEFDSSDNNVVRFGEDITIPEGKVIDGDVVALGGSVTVLGRVKGDVVSIGGAVEVKGKGVVEGDAVAMGGGVTTSDSASVAGSNVSLGSFPMDRAGRLWPLVGLFGLGTGFWLLQALVKLGLTLFFAWLALLLARERLVYAVETMYRQFGRSFLWGLAGFAGAVVALPTAIIVLILVGAIAVAILAITIIGIPVAILLLIAMVLGVIGMVLALLVAVFLGFLNGAMFLGQRVLGRSSPSAQKPLVAILVGMALLTVLEIAGKLIGLIGILVFHPIAIALGVAAGALAVILTIAGFGAIVTTGFATGPRGEGSIRSQWWPPSRHAPSAAPSAAPYAEPGARPPAVEPAGAAAATPREGGSSDAP